MAREPKNEQRSGAHKRYTGSVGEAKENGKLAMTEIRPEREGKVSRRAIPKPRLRLQLTLQVVCDLLAVEAAIFDEDFVGARACHNHARHVNSANIAFERHRIAHRTALLLRQFNPHTAQKIVVRVVTDQ